MAFFFSFLDFWHHVRDDHDQFTQCLFLFHLRVRGMKLVALFNLYMESDEVVLMAEQKSHTTDAEIESSKIPR